jgi:uncharacterized membrane protein YoaK (UPF0700 family)
VRKPATRLRPLLLTLTIAAASTDAVSYLGLGHVFPANMTGNTVLLGVGVASHDYPSAARSAVALGAFLLGAGIVGAGPPKLDVRWVLRGEFLLIALAAAWWSVVGTPTGGDRYGLIALVAGAMGVQSAAVARLRVSGVTTTYITGTWTAVSTWVGAHLRRAADAPPADRSSSSQHALQVMVLACYVCAALGAGFAFHAAGAPAAWIPVAAAAASAFALIMRGHSVSASREQPQRPGRRLSRTDHRGG